MKKYQKYSKKAAFLTAAAMLFGILPPSNILQASVRFDHVKVKDIYEAEDAEKIGYAKRNTDHTGYSGTGYCAGYSL